MLSGVECFHVWKSLGIALSCCIKVYLPVTPVLLASLFVVETPHFLGKKKQIKFIYRSQTPTESCREVTSEFFPTFGDKGKNGAPFPPQVPMYLLSSTESPCLESFSPNFIQLIFIISLGNKMNFIWKNKTKPQIVIQKVSYYCFILKSKFAPSLFKFTRNFLVW